MLCRFYKPTALSPEKLSALLRLIKPIEPAVEKIICEKVYYAETAEKLSGKDLKTISWLLGGVSASSHLAPENLIEIGPRLNFETPESANAVAICQSCGLKTVKRLEVARRYKLAIEHILSSEKLSAVSALLYDKMTECAYNEPLNSFEIAKTTAEYRTIFVSEEGVAALRAINVELGLGMDERDIAYYYYLFQKIMGRNPTDIELFQLGQMNSEHSRHHFFKGKLIIDGQKMPMSLMELVKDTLPKNACNAVVAFHDNASAITGFNTKILAPQYPDSPSPLCVDERIYHLTLTAETHNHPCLWSPYPGAATGGGGRRRDNQAIGRGGISLAASTGFSGGNLNLPGYPLPWEDKNFSYDPRTASPLDFFINATNGAYDEGNQFGEPVISGFARSFGMRINNERWEYVKPIMFSGGFGRIDHRHTEKRLPKQGHLIVKIGGPAYCVGVGGGAASSMASGENRLDLDYNSVQRADGEMAQKTWRTIRACVELGDLNPIESIHDQGAGGNCNVLTELLEPTGGMINIRAIPLGDKTMSALEIWGAEYQENFGLLIRPENWQLFQKICEREKTPCAIVGYIENSGAVLVCDELEEKILVNLNLRQILSKIPQKTFADARIKPNLQALEIPAGPTVGDHLKNVFRLLQVGSKKWLAHKVDRTVGGLVAQQQCVGPLQIPVADYAITAQGFWGANGEAASIGEQPIKGLLSPQAMARMAAGEALTNLMFAPITKLEEVQCSANWMLAAKFPGQGAWLYDAVLALNQFLKKIGVAIDGGKDSLSMAANIPLPGGQKELVKSPGTLVISTYAACVNFRKKVTPDLKAPGRSKLMFIDFGGGKTRLGGSALAQTLRQIGNESPDIEEPELLSAVFRTIQLLLDRRMILAGHDRSDGGIITTLMEMAFAGDYGFDVDFSGGCPAMEMFFNEELGAIIEYLPENEQLILDEFKKIRQGIAFVIGETRPVPRFSLSYNGEKILCGSILEWRDIWEETAYQTELKQTSAEYAKQEKSACLFRRGHLYRLSFDPDEIPPVISDCGKKPRVAIIREEGSNGDREMAAAFYFAGFEPWDITMTDIGSGRISLSLFRGLAFVGGFSFKDVLGSGRGWAGVIKFNERIAKEFSDFYRRPDTFGIGVCNGCQLMALLGWVPYPLHDAKKPQLLQNKSERFESRFVAVRIDKSPAIMLQGMEESILGVHIAHGEGRFYFPDNGVLKKILKKGLAPIRYTNDTSFATETYPFNPNGSPFGIAALASRDGRYLAMMPHPERAFLKWQWHYLPDEFKKYENSPWLRMFQNARLWCESGK